MSKSTCTKCGKKLERGRHLADPYRCDDCAGVERDDNGHAWEPYEQEHQYIDLQTGEITTVERGDALR